MLSKDKVPLATALVSQTEINLYNPCAVRAIANSPKNSKNARQIKLSAIYLLLADQCPGESPAQMVLLCSDIAVEVVANNSMTQAPQRLDYI